MHYAADMIALVLLVALVAAGSLTASGTNIGINLGNVLEAPTEGAWAPVAQQYYFDDYKAAGFTFVRVPVRWDEHTSKAPPFAIDAAFLARVEEVVGWATARNLSAIINSHHDDWIDSEINYHTFKPRFLSIWTQVSAAFAGVPDSLLRFEVINEPVNLTILQLNDMYASVVPIMRATNPTRAIYLGGLSWMSPYWVNSNPDAVVFPPLASGAADPNLRLEMHSYDPYTFCLQNPPTASSWGTPADVAAVNTMYENAAAWQTKHQRRVLMGEAGCQVAAPSRADRLLWYQTVGEAQKLLSDSLSVWDDFGEWKIYDRTKRTFDAGVLSALGLSAASISQA